MTLPQAVAPKAVLPKIVLPTILRRSAGAATLVALLLILFGLAAPMAAAAPAGASPSYVRLAHLSPDTPQVDVYVDSAADPARSFVVPGVGYGVVSDYRPMPADTYVISMRAAGAPADSPPVISATVQAQPGAAYTIAGTGRSAELGLSVLNDKLDMPPAGKASVRVINAALSVPVADVGPVDGRVWAQDVKFGTGTSYVDCPLGNWDLQVTLGPGVGDGAVDVAGELDLHRRADRPGQRSRAAGEARQHRRRHRSDRRCGHRAGRRGRPEPEPAAAHRRCGDRTARRRPRGGPRGPRADRDALTGWTSAGWRDRGRPDGGGPRPIAPRRGCLARSRGWRWRSRWGWACLPP